jgi:hypothetical protein
MASKRRIRRNACGNKVRYPNSSSAWQAANAIYKKKGVRLSFYSCNYCHSFHIGHTPIGVMNANINRQKDVAITASLRKHVDLALSNTKEEK